MGEEQDSRIFVSDSLADRFDIDAGASDDREATLEYIASGALHEPLGTNLTFASYKHTQLKLLAYELSSDEKIVTLECPSSVARAIFEAGLGIVKLEVAQGQDTLCVFDFDFTDERTILKLIKTGTAYELTIAWA